MHVDPYAILHGDALEVLKGLPDESVDCCVTSPPYWGLRDYGTGRWEGGDPACDHRPSSTPARRGVATSTLEGSKAHTAHQQEGYPGACPRCGARRVDQQIGLEATYQEYVANLTRVFAEVWRVLRPHGTLWLNLGDTYGRQQGRQRVGESVTASRGGGVKAGSLRYALARSTGLAEKNLVGIPWRVAFALQEAGWILRSEIIWHKTNPMPESVRDRPTTAHEHLFLLVKHPRYFYDAEAIAEEAQAWSGSKATFKREASKRGGEFYPGKKGTHRPDREDGYGHARPQYRRALELAREHGLTEAHLKAIRAVGLSDAGKGQLLQSGSGKNAEETQRLAEEAKAALGGYWREFLTPQTRNARSVWSIATRPFLGAHFAVMPEELARRCVMAGCPRQVCPRCGKPWERTWGRRAATPTGAAVGGYPAREDGGTRERDFSGQGGNVLATRRVPGEFAPTCGCGLEPISGVVLDPFNGAGTTGLAALRHGRRYIGIELNPAYIELSHRRLRPVAAQPLLLAGD